MPAQITPIGSIALMLSALASPLQGIHQPTAPPCFTYNSEYQDPQTRLLNLHAREYDPSAQSFISQDNQLGWNRYHFVQADPVNYIDPEGQWAEQLLSYVMHSTLIITSIGIIKNFWGFNLATAASLTGLLSGSSGLAAQASADYGNNSMSDQLHRLSNYSGVASLTLFSIYTIFLGRQQRRASMPEPGHQHMHFREMVSTSSYEHSNSETSQAQINPGGEQAALLTEQENAFADEPGNRTVPPWPRNPVNNPGRLTPVPVDGDDMISMHMVWDSGTGSAGLVLADHFIYGQEYRCPECILIPNPGSNFNIFPSRRAPHS